MSKFFTFFPKISYDIQGKRFSNYQLTTNIFFRLRVIREVLGNITTYYEHLIQDSDTPEILAEKVYGDSEAHWIILMANDIYDPQYDWPLNYDAFNKYIIKKYGSIETAKTTYHHYEKVIRREESDSGIISEFRYVINSANVANMSIHLSQTIPYDSYENLIEQDVKTLNQSGITIVEITSKDRISNYDYENSANEAKRNIKIIKPEYYRQIMNEFMNLTKFEPNYIRRVS